MNLELDLSNIPLDHLGFDSGELRDNRKNNYIDDISNAIQSECDKVPEIREFKSLMNNFFIGKVQYVKNGMYISQYSNFTDHKKSKEIYDIVENHIDYPDDENLKSRIFTQELNKEIGDKLSQYGLTLDNKYRVRTHSDFFTVSPLLHISDPELFIEFLQKIKFYDEDIIGHIDTILGGNEFWIEQFFLSGNKISDSTEISNFIIKAFDIWEEFERLEIEECLMNNGIRDLVLVTSSGLLEEYINFKRLGFFIQIYPDDGDNFESSFKIPTFIYDFLDMCSQYNDEEELKDCVLSIKENIKKSIFILSKIRNNPMLFNPLKEELQLGMRQLIEYIDANPNIKNHIKSEIIMPIVHQFQELKTL